jgi:hypothetical protein
VPLAAKNVILAYQLGLVLLLVFAFFRSNGLSFFRHRIVPARVKGVTSKDAPHRQKKSHEKAALAKGLKAVSGAGWGKPTGWSSFQRRDKTLIKADQPDTKPLHVPVE